MKSEVLSNLFQIQNAYGCPRIVSGINLPVLSLLIYRLVREKRFTMEIESSVFLQGELRSLTSYRPVLLPLFLPILRLVRNQYIHERLSLYQNYSPVMGMISAALRSL